MLLDNPRLKISIRELTKAKVGGKKQRRTICHKEFEAYLSAIAAMGESSVPQNLVTDLNHCLHKGKAPKTKDSDYSLLAQFVKWK